jgi:two-component system, LuxR family, sensor kinase FixL
MAMSLLSSNRLVNLGKVLALILLIALADWRIDAEVPLGFLYLLPVALAGAAFSRVAIVLLSIVCAILAELNDAFPWSARVGFPRDLLYFAAFCSVGLFVHEMQLNRRKSVLHLHEIEEEVRARQDAEEQLKVLIASSPIAILTTDSSGQVLLANDAANRLIGVYPATLEGKSIGAYLPSLTSVPGFRGGQPSFRTVMQCRGQREDGEPFIAEVWFSTYATSAGARLAAIIVDTSQDVRDREEANLHHLLAGSRILVAAVSHEVRNVCGAIAVVHSNLERDSALLGNKDFEALGTLVLALKKIASLDLRHAMEQPARIDLQSFIEELKVIVNPALREKDIEAHWELSPNLPAVWADRQTLTQVFLNLTRNSENAMAHQKVRRLTIQTSVAPKRVSISVIDNGPGVQIPELLFKPFQDRSRHVGLGLYLSRALLRSFGGDLRHEPSSQGAAFVVELAYGADEVPDGVHDGATDESR